MRFRAARATRLLVFSALLGCCFGSFASEAARAGYPERPIRLVVPFGAGGTADIVARTVTDVISREPGWSMFVDNVAGAGGSLGAAAVARAPADGYTLVLCNVSCAVHQYLVANSGFDSKKDFEPVILVSTIPSVLVTGSAVPASTLAEFLALARAKPGQISMASAGLGSTSHLSAELLRVLAHVDLLDVPYRGSAAALPDIIAGRVDSMVSGLPEVLSFIRDGKLRALGVTSTERLPVLPEVPTIAQAGVPGYSLLGWLSVFVPTGTPASIVTTLNHVFNTSLKSSQVLERFASQNIDAVGGSPDSAGKLLSDEIVMWGDVLKTRGNAAPIKAR